ncbi:MAG: hypothetical protein QM606_08850 [Leucobacter sp.]
MSRDDRLELQLTGLFASEETGEAPALDHDPYTFTILTVCTGNICRSPLAEGLLRARLGGSLGALGVPGSFLDVSSSGLGALAGHRADRAVRSLAESMAVSLDAHRARQFEPIHAERAHLVLTATRTQRDDLSALAPSATARCFALAEFVRLLDRLEEAGELEPSPTRLHRPTRVSRRLQRVVAEAGALRSAHPSIEADDIEDPFRRGDEVHARVAARISELCDAIVARLTVVLG